MNTKFLKSMKVLKDAIDSKKLVIFAGAGTSIDSGAPSWRTLIDELTKGISIPEYEQDFLKISQIYYNERGHKEYLDEIRNILKYKTLKFNLLHELIFELQPEHILTTNYDDLFEQVIKSKAHPYSIIKKDADFPYANNTNLLVKIHGDLEEGNIVLKEDDYINYSNNFPLIESFMKGLFATKVVLFIGYSFSDYNLKYIINNVKNILGNDFQKAYLLSFDPSPNLAMQNYLKAKGVNVIHYKEISEELENYLLGKNAYNQTHQNENSNLSELGSKLSSFLKFIIKYKDFTETISKFDIVTQLEKSLGRFSEFISLPPTFVSNLYPINISNKPISNYRFSNFSSNNFKIKELFGSLLEENGELKEVFFSKYNIPIEKKALYNRKMGEIFKTLSFSTLRFFTDSINNYNFPRGDELRNAYVVPHTNESCDCLTCLLGDFKFDELFIRLKSITINETSDIKIDILVAYLNYKIGNFTLSFFQFESIANKAWQIEKYKLYYVAKRNAKHLRNLIDSHFTKSDNQKTSDILDRISSINLDKLLFQIPKLDDDEYLLLNMIRDNTVLKNCESDINDIADQINKDYVQAATHSGYTRFFNYSADITHHLLDVFKFYNNNCIVQDEYLEFARVFQKGTRALFMNYSLGLKHGQKIPFQWWIFKHMIYYLDPIILYNEIKEFHIKDLNIVPKENEKLFNDICCLLNSTWTENVYLRGEITKNRGLSSHLQNSYFENKFNEILSNTFIVLSIIEIPERLQPILVKKALNFVTVEDYLHAIHFRHVIKFLINYHSHISPEQLESLFKISIGKPNLIFDWKYWELLGKTCKALNKKLENDELVKKAIFTITSDTRYQEFPFMLVYNYCNPPIQEIIKKILVDQLSRKFDSTTCYQACILDILNVNSYAVHFVNELESFLSDARAKDNTIFLPSTLRNIIILIHSKSLPPDCFTFPNFESYPHLWRFLLKPEDFIESDYNAAWNQIVESFKLLDLDTIKSKMKKG